METCNHCAYFNPQFRCEHCPDAFYCGESCQLEDHEIHSEFECLVGKRAAGGGGGRGRTKLSRRQRGKVSKVMREFNAGTLKSGSGHAVTDKKQALAIAYAEAKKE